MQLGGDDMKKRSPRTLCMIRLGWELKSLIAGVVTTGVLSAFRAWACGSYLLYGNSQVLHKTNETVIPVRTVCEALKILIL